MCKKIVAFLSLNAKNQMIRMPKINIGIIKAIFLGTID